jgi:cell division protein FtsN
MTRFRLVSVALALLLAGPALVRAQSLGEVAKREQEKQEKKKKSGKPPATVKVYTEEDLKKARESESGAVTVLPENGNVDAAPAASSEDDEVVSGEGRPAGGRRRTEAYWRGRATRLRDAVAEADQRIKELETRIAGLRNDMNPTNLQDPNRLQTRDRELREAMGSLDAARREAETARKALDGLEEEARRAGAPPGWVR